MTKFPKGHNLGFKKGQVPHNKLRQCVKTIEKDIKLPEYKRLTRKMTNLVQNVPYKDEESSALYTAAPAKLLRPKPNVTKMDKKTLSVTEMQR